MADLILIKGGNGTVPHLEEREPAYSKDEKALYIGTESGNVRLCGKDDATRLNALDKTISELNARIEDITARLETLETPTE